MAINFFLHGPWRQHNFFKNAYKFHSFYNCDSVLQKDGMFGHDIAVVDLNADGINDLAVSAPSVGSPELTYNVSYFYMSPSL